MAAYQRIATASCVLSFKLMKVSNYRSHQEHNGGENGSGNYVKVCTPGTINGNTLIAKYTYIDIYVTSIAIYQL